MADDPTVFTPPNGSVFDTLTGKDGPPMMRMMMIQMSFEAVKKFRRCTNRGRMLIVLIISLTFIIGDMKQYAT